MNCGKNYLILGSEWEKEILELLNSIDKVPINDLLKEIAETPIPLIDFEPLPKPRRLPKRTNFLGTVATPPVFIFYFSPIATDLSRLETSWTVRGSSSKIGGVLTAESQGCINGTIN